MNIFFVDKDPSIAARYLHNKHVAGKMALEGLQMLVNCFSEKALGQAPKTKKGTPWKHSHFNHPMSKWVRESRNNFDWLYKHIYELSFEYQNRYKKESTLRPMIYWMYHEFYLNGQPNNLSWNIFTLPPLCMPDECRGDVDNINGVVALYRYYYISRKYHWFSEKRNKWYFNKWPSLEAIPDWFKNSFPQEQLKNFVK